MSLKSIGVYNVCRLLIRALSPTHILNVDVVHIKMWRMCMATARATNQGQTECHTVSDILVAIAAVDSSTFVSIT
jgi:hypothetical protein